MHKDFRRKSRKRVTEHRPKFEASRPDFVISPYKTAEEMTMTQIDFTNFAIENDFSSTE